MKNELKLKYASKIKGYFWTDSEVVLSYINNESKRFKVFVANRVQMIRDHSDPSQWYHVNTKLNPADDTSRGLDAANMSKVKRWYNGPEFLWLPEETWKRNKVHQRLDYDDPEIKNEAKVNFIKSNPNSILNWLEASISSWNKMKRIVAIILRYKWILKQKILKKPLEQLENINVQLLEAANLEIVKMVQQKHFSEELKIIKRTSVNDNETYRISKSSKIYGLDPFIDCKGIVRVGGRLKRSNLNENMKHPMLLPRKSITTKRIIEWCHAKVGHSGRNITLNEIRNNGYWIISANAAVRSYIHHCVNCRKLRGCHGEQNMSDLPEERSSDAPPFTYVGIDMFGPFLIKEGRKELKRYGAMFTCLASRAIHIEVARSMDTDSFIMCLRRFIGRRGNVRMIRSDNGSNFIGAEKELNKAFLEMNQNKIQTCLQSLGTGWILSKKNPPAGSHFGGVWGKNKSDLLEQF